MTAIHDPSATECTCRACCIARAEQILANGAARVTALVAAGREDEAARECGARTPEQVAAWIAKWVSYPAKAVA